MSEEGFLARWSRRKREAVRPPAEVPAPPPAAAPPPPAEAPPPFDPATLPPVESLTVASDIRDFLRAEVPRALREAALRRVWTLDPAIRDFIGPADYAWDFNAPDGVPGFADKLTGELGELIAQAIGTKPDPAPEAPQAPEAASAEALAAAPPELPAGSPPGPVPALAVAPPAPGVEMPPAPEPEAPVAPSRRRHGSALPA